MGDGLLDDVEDFEAIFKMMQDEETPSCSSTAEPEAKRARTADEPGSRGRGRGRGGRAAGGRGGRARGPLAGAAAGPSRALSSEVVEVPAKDQEPPPEKVIMAFKLLDLPITASCSEVARQGRLLARTSHPDKVAPDFPEERKLAAQCFQELTEARDTAIAWLQGRLGPDPSAYDWWQSSEEEAVSPAASDIAGDPDERDELRACGLPEAEGIENYPASPPRPVAGDSEDELFGREEDGVHTAAASALATAAEPGGIVVVGGSNPIEQAAALARALEGAAAGPKLCSECLERKAAKDKDVCRQCEREMASLLKSLNRA